MAFAYGSDKPESWSGESGAGPFDKIVVNDDLETAYHELEDWVVDGGKWGGEA